MIVEGTGFCVSPSLNYFCAVTFSPGGGGVKRWFGKPADRDEVKGEAFSVHPDTVKEWLEKKEPRKDPGLKHGKKLAYKMFDVEGRWSEEIVAGEAYVIFLMVFNGIFFRKFDVTKTTSPTLFQSNKSLPSDSSFRLDHLHMLTGEIELASVIFFS